MKPGIRELVFLVVLLAVPVGAYFFVFQPRNAEIARARTEIQTKQEKLDQLTGMGRDIEAIETRLADMRQSLSDLDERIPSENELDDVLRQIDAIARSNRLSVDRVSFGAEKPAANHAERTIDVSLEGRFDGFYDALRGIESMPRITRILDLKLEKATTGRRGEATPVEGGMRAEFKLSVYFDPDGGDR